MKTQINKTAETFIRYTFKGNGKYHTTLHIGRNFSNSTFTNFANKNADCINIVEYGNDAPRGGKVGNYVIVEFLPAFYEKYAAIFAQIEKEKQREVEIKELAEMQKAELSELFKKDAEFLDRIKNRIKTSSSKDWRGWVKMKVCAKITNGKFEDLHLTATQIRIAAGM